MTGSHRTPWSYLLPLLALTCLGLGANLPAATGVPEFAQPITVNGDGTLTYVPNPRGDVVPDFSTCGWRNGDEPLPGQPGGITIADVEALDPGTGDQSDRVQAAINRVSARNLDTNGFRGAIRLKAGLWEFRRSISINASGVVLRGDGQDPINGTRLWVNIVNTNGSAVITKNSTFIVCKGASDTPGWNDNDATSVLSAPQVDIANVTVPVGSLEIPLASAHTFSVGELVRVYRPNTQQWLLDTSLHLFLVATDPAKKAADATFANSAADKAERLAKATKYFQLSHRRVISTTSTSITLNAPITTAITPAYGGGKVLKVTKEGFIKNVGIENLYIYSTYSSPTDENHIWNVSEMTFVEDGWVQNVTSRYFAYSMCYLDKVSRQITVERCQFLDPVSQIVGGRRYSYVNDGELTLVRDCYTRDSRHDFPTNWYMTAGPQAFVDCKGDFSNNESGSHDNWSTGTLWDNINTRSIQNKTERMTANTIIWNCISWSTNLVENPVSAQNWGLGMTNTTGGPATIIASTSGGSNGVPSRPGEIFSNGTPMTVRSLHDAQVAARRALQGRTHTPKVPAIPTTVAPVLPIIQAAWVGAKAGTAFSYTIEASGLPRSYNATGRPTGLTIATSTGIISGTPTLPVGTTVPVTTTITVSATNRDGTTTASLPITVYPASDTTTVPLTLTLAASVPTDRLLDNLTVVGDGNPVSVEATTAIPGLSVPISITYNGSATAPSAAGTYAVVATVSHPLYTGSANGTLIIKTAATVSMNGTTTPIYTGAGLGLTTSTTPTGLTVAVTYDGSSTVPINAGTYFVRATITDPAYYGTTTKVLTIKPKPVTVTLSNLSQSWTGSPLAPTVTTNPPGLTVDLSYNSGAVTTPTEIGSYTVIGTINQANYTGASSSTPFTITKATATVQFSGITKAYDGTALVPTVITTPAGLPVIVSYAHGSAPVAVADSSTVTATINDAHYAGTGSASLTITKATATVTVDAASLAQVYDGTPRSVIVSTVPSGLATTIRYGGSATAPINAGSYVVTAAISATEANYAGSSPNVTLVVAKAPVTVALQDLTQDFTGTPRPITATTTPSGQTVTITYAGSATAPTAAGTYAVTGTVNTTNGAGTTTDTLTIKPVISTTGPLQAHQQTAYALQILALGSPTLFEATGLPTGLTISAQGLITGTPTTTGTFTATLRATKAGATGTRDVVFSVLRADQNLTWATPASIIYGSALGTTQLNASSTVAGSMTYDPPAGTVLQAGSHLLQATFTPDDLTTYQPVSTAVTLVVSPAPLSVTVSPATRLYGDANPTFVPVVNGLVGSDAVNAVVVTTTAGVTSAVGSYPLVPSTPTFSSGSASNYTVTKTNGSLTITPAPLIVTAADAQRLFGAAEPTFSLLAITGLRNTDSVASATIRTGTSLGSAVGIYPLTPSAAVFRAGLATNYQITYQTGTLTILPAPLTISLPQTVYRLQGTANPVVNGTATGLRAGNALTGVDIAFPAIDVLPGNYSLSLSNGRLSPGSISNYTVTYQAGTLTVIDPATVREPVITWNPTTSITYGTALGSAHLNATADVPGTFTYQPPLGTVLATGADQVLTATFTPTDAVLNAPVTVSRTFSVQTATLTIQAAQVSRAYGAADPVWTTVVTGLQGSDQVLVTVSSTATTTTAVGLLTGALIPAAPVFLSGSADNYTITLVPGDLQITPAALRLTATNAQRQIGSANPAFTVTVTGLVNGDQLQEPLEATTTATVDSATGSYPITPITPVFASGSARNYTLAMIAGRLTVTPILPAITLTGPLTGSVGESLSFTITTTGGPTSFLTYGLPPGLTVNTQTGLVSGIPTVAGTYAVTLVAMNSQGEGQQVVTIEIQEAKDPLASALSPSPTPSGCGTGAALAVFGGLLALGVTGRRRRS